MIISIADLFSCINNYVIKQYMDHIQHGFWCILETNSLMKHYRWLTQITKSSQRELRSTGVGFSLTQLQELTVHERE